MKKILNFFVHNWLRIFYLNFHCLPFKQAVKLPIDVYGPLKVVSLNGNIKINGPIRTGMIKIGSQGSDMFPKSETVLSVDGVVTLNGRTIIGMGSSIICKKKGHLTFGNNTIIGAKNLVFCTTKIVIGDNFLSSWDCQIMDSDTHSIANIQTGIVSMPEKPIIISKNVWVGNGVIINKGTQITQGSIVASRSLCNKDYSSYGNNCLLAGCPAVVKSTNIKWSL